MIVLGFIAVFVAGLLIGGATASVMDQAENSKTHAKHLEAVEKAIGILSDAGVEL